jgi:hypothetical protein
MARWLVDEFSIWGIHVQNWMMVATAIVVSWLIYLRAKSW